MGQVYISGGGSFILGGIVDFVSLGHNIPGGCQELV